MFLFERVLVQCINRIINLLVSLDSILPCFVSSEIALKESSADPCKEKSKDVQREPISGTQQPPASPGAYSINVPAPVYVMEGDDENEEDYEAIPEHLLRPQQRISSSYGAEESSRRDESSSHNGPIILDAEVQVVETNIHDEKSEQSPTVCSRKRLLMGGVVASILVIVVVVIMAIVVAGGSDGGGDVPLTVVSPTVAPTQADPNFCYDAIRETLPVLTKRGYAADFTQLLEVRLCPNKNFVVSKEVWWYEPWLGKEPPLIAQSNLHIKCGQNGSLTDRCVVWGGASLMLNVYSTQAPGERAARGVVVEGITFEQGLQSLLDLRSAGDITFRNCLFRVSCI